MQHSCTGSENSSHMSKVLLDHAYNLLPCYCIPLTCCSVNWLDILAPWVSTWICLAKGDVRTPHLTFSCNPLHVCWLDFKFRTKWNKMCLCTDTAYMCDSGTSSEQWIYDLTVWPIEWAATWPNTFGCSDTSHLALSKWCIVKIVYISFGRILAYARRWSKNGLILFRHKWDFSKLVS